MGRGEITRSLRDMTVMLRYQTSRHALGTGVVAIRREFTLLVRAGLFALSLNKLEKLRSAAGDAVPDDGTQFSYYWSLKARQTWTVQGPDGPLSLPAHRAA